MEWFHLFLLIVCDETKKLVVMFPWNTVELLILNY